MSTVVADVGNGTWAKVICDSVGKSSKVRLTTMELNYPCLIHPEFMTHRVFSRNAASMRAIPTDRVISQVDSNPFVPEKWPVNQKGMVPSGYVTDPDEIARLRASWLAGKDLAVNQADLMARRGIHKQIATRPLMPYAFIRVIVSATEWDNFLALRSAPDAQYEIQMLARAISSALYLSVPEITHSGGLHLPYVMAEDYLEHGLNNTAVLTRLSVARCARVSYLTHDGTRNPYKDIELHDRLLESGHMSPFEHPATALNTPMQSGNFRGWRQYRKTIPSESLHVRKEPK